MGTTAEWSRGKAAEGKTTSPAVARRDAGAVHAYVAIVLPVMIAMMGLAIDTGYMVWVGQQLQIAADASALAGVQLIRTNQDDARNAAINIAALNEAVRDPVTLELNADNLEDGDIVVGDFDRYTRTFTPTTSEPNAIKVVARRTTAHGDALQLLFGPILGFDTADIQREAIAILGGGTGAGLLCLDPNPPPNEYGLLIQGGATVNLNGGAIQVNAEGENGAKINYNFTTNAGDINVYGDITTVGSTDPVVDELLNANTERSIPDPLAALPPPNWATMPVRSAVSVRNGETVTVQPGYYQGAGIRVTGGTVTFAPGIYVLEDGFDVQGGTITGSEVMFYIKGGSVGITGTTDINLSPPMSGTYEDVTFFQARDNTSSGIINGTSEIILEGTLYFPNNWMRLGGTATLGNQFIVGRAEILGTANLIVAYDGRNPAPGFRPFLVA